MAVQTLVIKLGSDISEAINGLDAVGVKATKLGRDMERTGRTLTRNVTLPLAALGAASFKVAADFESSLGRMEGLVGVQRDTIDAWRGDIRDLAVDYGSSATEAADAMFFITSAGLRGSEALNVLEASLKASAAGLGETKTIADLATSALNAYGSDVLSAADATDVLTAAVREGKLEPAELSSAMGQVLPVASSLGVSFDQVGAAMAAMSRTGTSASEASTQLRSILTGLMKPTAKGEKALADLGMTYGEIRSQIREEGLLAALQDLTSALGEDEEATAAVFGNKRALVGVLDLMGSNAATTAEIFESMADTSGTLDDAWQAVSETANQQLNRALAASKDLLVEIGEIILPFATKTLSTLADMLKGTSDALDRMSPAMKKVALATAGVAAAIGPLLLGGGKMLKLFGFILTPAGAVVTILSTLAFTIGVVASNWDVLKVRTTLVWTAIKSAVLDAVGGILGALESMVGWVPVLGDKVSELKAKFDAFATESLAESGRRLAELESDLASAGDGMNEFRSVATETANALADGSGQGALERVRNATRDITASVVGGAVPALRTFKAETIASKEEMIDFDVTADESLTNLEEGLNSVASRGLDALADFATGGKNALGNFVSFALKELAKLIAKLLIVRALGFIFPGSSGLISSIAGISGRQTGGPVQPGRAYRVGEFGAETFVPDRPGRIASASETSGGGGPSASEILATLGPPPQPMTPAEVARDRWYREFISIAVPDFEERSGRG